MDLNRIPITAVLVLLAFWLPGFSAAEAYPRIAILYPEVRAPYNKIFEEIVAGIEEQTDAAVTSRKIGENTSAKDIDAWLESEKIESIITLGNGGMQFAEKLNWDCTRLAGAVFLKQETLADGLNAIALIPSPERLFDRLKALAPQVNKVTVIYDPDEQQWLIDEAAEAAGKAGLTLNALKASDVREAASVYQEIMRGDIEKSNALWLLQGGPGTRERSIIEEILKKAWDENLVVFSNNPGHVKRGALFSLFPDNRRLGRSLAAASMKLAKGEDVGIELLKDLQVAVNIRTADHIGLKISRDQRREFNMVFPAR
jgi:putative ABC transport system substrate-binding protein